MCILGVFRRTLSFMVLVSYVTFGYTYVIDDLSSTKLIIDQDGGADDSMAIFLALLNEKCNHGPKVIALTTTHGNVYEDQVYINTQKILSTADRTDIPIYRGFNLSMILDLKSDNFFGSDGLGDVQNFGYQHIHAQNVHAAVALVEFSKAHEGNLVVVAIGTLTNIAIAIRLDPKFLGRLKHLYIGAGHVYSENFPQPEYNALYDAEAYFMAVRDANPEIVTVIPYSQTISTMNLPLSWRQDVLGTIQTNIMKAQNRFEQVAWSNITNGLWNLLDPVVLAASLNPSVTTESRYTRNSIILCGDQRGINTNDFVSQDEANVQMSYSFSTEAYQRFLVNTLSGC